MEASGRGAKLRGRLRWPAAVAAAFLIALAAVELGAGVPVRKIGALFARTAWHQSPRDLYQIAVFAHLLHTDQAQRRFNPRTGIRDLGPRLEECRADPDCGRDTLGRLQWETGRYADAVSTLQAHVREHDSDLRSRLWLALAYLRLSEERNCLPALTAAAAVAPGAGHDGDGHAFRLQQNPDPLPHHYMCALPGGDAYANELDSLQAAAVLREILDEFEARPLRARWRTWATEVDADLTRYLLFFACLRVERESDPECVPPRYRIPPDSVLYRGFFGDVAFRGRVELGGIALSDTSRAFDVHRPNDAGRGVVVEDFDRDGDLDLLWCGGFEPCQLRVWESGAYVDATERFGMQGYSGIHIATGADADGDGYVDVLLSRPWGAGQRGDFVLLRNEGGRRFRPITVEAGLLPPEAQRGDVSIMPWISAWGDVDADGDLDLLVGTWGFYSAEGKTDRSGRHDASYSAALRDNFQTTLYRNQLVEEGRLGFVDVTESWFPERWAWDGDTSAVRGQNVWAADFGDYDRDGDLDLVVSRQYIPGVLLLRNEGGRFERTGLIESSAIKFMVRFIDVNHDGRLDVYASGLGLARAAAAQVVFGRDPDLYDARSTIYLQDERGGFARRDDLLVNSLPLAVMGVNFGDLNNDGAYELYQGVGNPQGEYIFPNLLYVGLLDAQGNPDGRMRNASMLHGVGNIQKGHGVAFLDPTGEGRQDIFSNLGGMWGGDRWPSQYFENRSPDAGAWTRIRLRGTRANRLGAGATLEVVGRSAAGTRRVRHFQMGNGTGFGSQPYRIHAGLHDSVSIEAVWVRWLGPEPRERLYCGVALGAVNLLLEEAAPDEPGGIPPSTGPCPRVATGGSL